MKLRLVLLLFVSVKCVHAGLVLSPPGSAPPGSPGDPTVDGGVGMGADINVVAGRAQGLGAGVADVGAGTGGVLDSGVGGGTMETGVAGGVIDTAGAPGGVLDAGAAGGTIDVGAGAVAGAEIGVAAGVGADVGMGVGPSGVGTDGVMGPGGFGAGVGPDAMGPSGADPAGLAGSPEAVATELTISPEQRRLNQKCRRECSSGSCYLRHEIDCRMYYVCDRNAEIGYWGTEQPCPHGTFWSGSNPVLSQIETTCALPQDVKCPNDPCLIPENDGGAYSHPKSCKQYWRCEGGISVPKCCPGYERYNTRTGNCEYKRGAPCDPQVCPFIADTCKSPDVISEPMNDGVCGSFWACKNGSPFPACCPAGQRYSVSKRTCELDPIRPCTDVCEYTEIVCLSDGEMHYLKDQRCRTYIKCVMDEVTQDFRAERRCCRSEFVFDRIENRCVKSPGPSTECSMDCPKNYIPDCHLLPVPGVPDAYITESHGIQTTMPCSPGSVFSVETCGCGIAVEGAPDNSCAMQLDIQFHWPKYKNYGSENMVNIQQNGNAGEGSILNGQGTYRFDGNLVYKVDYLQQALPEFFFQVDYLPETAASNKKVILVSNCKQAARPNHPAGEPSFEVTLENGNVVLRAQTPTDRVELRNPYKPGTWNQVKMYYDKANVLMSNQAADMREPTFQTGPLNGAINQAMEGLEIGSCERNIRDRKMPSYEGFIGDIAKVAASKCLSREQKKFLTDRLPVPMDKGQGMGPDTGLGPEIGSGPVIQPAP